MASATCGVLSTSPCLCGILHGRLPPVIGDVLGTSVVWRDGLRDFIKSTVDAPATMAGRRQRSLLGRRRGSSSNERRARRGGTTQRIRKERKLGESAVSSVSQMGTLPAAVHGDAFDNNVTDRRAKRSKLPSGAFGPICSSRSSIGESPGKLIRPSMSRSEAWSRSFRRAHWQTVARREVSARTAECLQSNDPTQWLFDGHPRVRPAIASGCGPTARLSVAAANRFEFPRLPSLWARWSQQFSDDDGIVCISASQGRRAGRRTPARSTGSRLR